MERSRGTARAAALGVGLTVAVLVGLELLRQGFLAADAPLPGAVLAPALLAVVYATFVGGRGAGTVSAALLTIYSTYALSLSGYDQLSIALRVVAIGGSAFALVGLLSGLTARAEALAERALAQERAQATRLERANADLQRANEMLEAFAYVTAHDLKEPVRATDEHLARLDAHALTPEARGELDAARTQNRRLTKLLHGLLEYSRASMTTPEKEPYRVQDVLRDETCEAQYAPILHRRDGILEIDAEIPPVQGSLTGLSQIFGNLILNALKHNPRHAPLVRVGRGPEPREGYVHIRIEDDGPGFPPEVIQRFETLRADRPNTVRGGFGLAVTRRAVERLGGSMQLSNGERGACVHLHLRAAPGAAAATRVTVEPVDRAAAPPPAAPEPR